MDDIRKMNHINEANNIKEPNFLEQLSEYRYFKKLFEIKIVKKVCALPFVIKIFDHKVTRKLMNRETIMYLIIGFLATVVNVGAFAIFRNVMLINRELSNFLAIASSILFSFMPNKLWVFRSKTNNNSELFAEFIKFISARSITAALEMVGVPFLVLVFGAPEIPAKMIMTVLVIITNYILSKKAIFKEKI